jgi:GDPmannose 4,6-dehydratase
MFGNGGRAFIYTPASPYAVAKLMAHYNAKRHVDSGRFAVSAILYNHESERRHESFVTQKICKFVARVKKWKCENLAKGRGEGEKPKLSLGNITAVRDWGYAPQYMKIVWRMMQQDEPSIGEVIGTGKAISVREFAMEAFEYVGLDFSEFVEIEPGLIRPNDVQYLKAVPTVANKLLDREDMVNVYSLCHIMVNHQLKKEGLA